MLKKSALSFVFIFVSWFIIDFVLHGILLHDVYQSTASLWRPSDQMNIPLIYLVTTILVLCFVLIYVLLVDKKSPAAGLKLGMLLGLITGIASGFGTYLHMPVPFVLAISWFLGGLCKSIVAGLILGIVIKTGD